MIPALVAAILFPAALVAVAALAFVAYDRTLIAKAPSRAHEEALRSLEERLKAVEETLRSEGRLANLGAAFGRKK